MTATKIAMNNSVSVTNAEDQKQAMRRLMMHDDETGTNTIHAPDGNRPYMSSIAPATAYTSIAAKRVTHTLVGHTVADVECDLILETLKHCLGNRTHAAHILGISIRTLRNKLNEYADEGLPITPSGGIDCHNATATT